MANKRYNTKTFDFVVNGEHVYFTCDTTNTKNGFCHHVLQVEAANITSIPAYLT